MTLFTRTAGKYLVTLCCAATVCWLWKDLPEDPPAIRTIYHDTMAVFGEGEALLSPKTTDQASKEINPHPYQFIINKPDLCKVPEGQELLVVILVASKADNFPFRKRIRDTWGDVAINHGFKVAFLLGLPRQNSTRNKILAEDAEHKDLIQEDFADSYQNLTLKTVMLVRWVTEYCPKVKFVLKADEDVMVNVWSLWVQVQTSLRGCEETIWGRLMRNMPPVRNSRNKWFVPESMYEAKVYPDYVAGPAYLFTGDCAPLLYTASMTTPFLTMEDVYMTGVVATKVGIVRVRHPGINGGPKELVPCGEPPVLCRGFSGSVAAPSPFIDYWERVATKNKSFRCKLP
ncbi:beta-1,3-galactosyltransferase 1-like [Ornithodoros turicata]|uniref:beta-1,3-galactosyltransferase 1-like n=1 Tax=Ornithodoros turicata TaxID=34597 RepID=UPI00313914EE